MHFHQRLYRVHIRRTDKIRREAEAQPVERYMKHVINWYKEKLKKSSYNGKKNVYVATDDVEVVKQLKIK